MLLQECLALPVSASSLNYAARYCCQRGPASRFSHHLRRDSGLSRSRVAQADGPVIRPPRLILHGYRSSPAEIFLIVTQVDLYCHVLNERFGDCAGHVARWGLTTLSSVSCILLICLAGIWRPVNSDGKHHNHVDNHLQYPVKVTLRSCCGPAPTGSDGEGEHTILRGGSGEDCDSALAP